MLAVGNLLRRRATSSASSSRFHATAGRASISRMIRRSAWSLSLRLWFVVSIVQADARPGANLRRAAEDPSFEKITDMELIHTCYRITDIDRSVAFYEALGFEKRGRMPIRDEAINVFMGLPGDGDRLELTYNFGVDSYELGTGYGHIAVTVDDLDPTLERLAEKGIEPEKPPYSVREGGSRLCFVRDPDGYRIELIERR
jgi:lactoylglutathione lyase